MGETTASFGSPKVQSKLAVVPCNIDDAKAFVKQHHRHHSAPLGGKCAVAVADDSGQIRGVAILSRPVARNADDGWTLEVTRVATDGCENACSCLYGASWRIAKSLGFRRLITYTLKSESGTSLVAAGWRVIGETPGGTWSRENRPRIDKHPLQGKFRWEPRESAAM